MCGDELRQLKLVTWSAGKQLHPVACPSQVSPDSPSAYALLSPTPFSASPRQNVLYKPAALAQQSDKESFLNVLYQ